MKYMIEGFNPNKDMLLYHGGSKKLSKFQSGILFLTTEEEEAIEFGKGVHVLGQYGRVSYLYTIAGKEGKNYNADDIIMAFIMEDEHPEIGDYMGDLDSFLEDVLAPRLRKKGYRYFNFEHPSSLGGSNINVIVSLYPEKDLEIVDVEEM